MRIESSSLVLGSAHELRQSISRKESFRSWGGETPRSEPASASAAGSSRSAQPAALLAAAQAGLGEPVGSSHTVKSTKETDDSDEYWDAATRLLKMIIEKMFGGRMQMPVLPKGDTSKAPPQGLPASGGNAAPAPPAWGLEYKLDQVSQETEQLSFAAAGVIRTADQREISFSLSLQMARSTVLEQHVEFSAGEKVQVDPLVLTFDGSAAELRSGTFEFDLQGDGKTENLALLGKASGFLALDRNHDGQINNGTELFGPTTGNGFSELRQFDSDKNGWIDENDSVYTDLRVWQPVAEGEGSLATLAQKNVGAICLDSVSTPFTYKDGSGQSQATTSATSVFVQENGTPGAIQELNYLA